MSNFGAKNFLFEVAKGVVPGHFSVHLFGRNPLVNKTTYEDIWETGGIKNFLTSASTLELISTSANDTALGTGARSIVLIGLDSNFDLAIENLATNGTSPSAPSSTSFIRLLRAQAQTGGAYGQTDDGGNDGDITVRLSSAGATQGTILTENNLRKGQTHLSHFTVPNGFTAFIYSIHISVQSSKAANVVLLQRDDADVVVAPFSCPRVIDRFDGVIGQADEHPQLPYELPAKTDVWFAAIGGANGSEIEVDYTVVLVAENLTGLPSGFRGI